MRIEHDDLDEAAKAGIISSQQAKALWAFWQNENVNTPQFRLSHVLYYFGGLLAISAITLFVTEAWDSLRGIPLFILSAALFVLGLCLAQKFLQKNLLIPAGIMSTFSLALVPLAVYNIQLSLGLVPHPDYHYADYNALISWYWVPMELATLLVGAIMLYRYQFPFLLFPISITLWYMSMDLNALLLGMHGFDQQAMFSLLFGLVIIIAAVYMDFTNSDNRKDYAFWLYIFGVMAFWGGLTCQDSHSELGKFFYCLINIAMILVSVFLNRRVFAVFGAFGVLAYLGHLAFSIFANSLGFPLALVLLGFIIIFAASRWSRVEHRLVEYFHPYIPKKILKRMDE